VQVRSWIRRNRGGGRLRRGGGPLLLAVRALTIAGLFSAAATVPAAASPAGPARGPVPRGDGISMLISPPRLIIPARQATRVQYLEVENRGGSWLSVHAETEALAQGSDGSSLPEPSAPYSAARWVTVVPSSFRVRPGSRRYIAVRFHVPADAEPGDHYLAIIFLMPPSRGPGSIHVAAGIGVPALLTVPGPVTDRVTVTRLTASGFSAGGPVSLTATIQESGDVHHSFTGHFRLAVRDGQTVFRFPDFTVLRGSTITITARWPDPPAFCLCHLTTAVVVDGQRSIATATIVIFPVIPVLTGLAILLALAALFLLARRYQRGRLSAAFEAGRRHGGSDGDPVIS
jgi:hypothetical protein